MHQLSGLPNIKQKPIGQISALTRDHSGHGSANKIRRNNVTSSLIGWAYTQNDPCRHIYVFSCRKLNWCGEKNTGVHGRLSDIEQARVGSRMGAMRMYQNVRFRLLPCGISRLLEGILTSLHFGAIRNTKISPEWTDLWIGLFNSTCSSGVPTDGLAADADSLHKWPSIVSFTYIYMYLYIYIYMQS